MKKLADSTCVACSKSAKTLSSDEISVLMLEINGWALISDSGIQKLKRVFKVKNYIEAVALTHKIADLAETADHHPKIILEYGAVTVIWWSHNIQGLHKNDFIMADKTSQLSV